MSTDFDPDPDATEPPRALGVPSRGGAAPLERTVLAIYRCPDYVRWAVEAWSEQRTGGALDRAGEFLITSGLSKIWQFPGVRDVSDARKVALRKGCAETMDWFNSFPPIGVAAVGTEDSRAYRLHISKTLAKTAAKLARALGLPQSRLGLYLLMAGLLQERAVSHAKYRKAMVETLRDFKDALERRGPEARARAEATPDRDAAEDDKWTLADVLRSAGNGDGNDQEL